MACQVIDWAIQAHGGGGVWRRLPAGQRLRARARIAPRRRPGRSAPQPDRPPGAGQVRLMSGAQFAGTKPVGERHASTSPRWSATCARTSPGFRGPARRSSSSRAASRTRPTSWSRRRARATCCAASRPGKLLPSAHAIEREFRVMRALHGTGVPVPRMLRCARTRAVIGRAFYVMEFVDGPRAVGPVAARHDARPSARAIYDEMNRVIARCTGSTPRRVGLADYGKPGNYFERQIGRWSKQYRASRDRARSRRWTG